MIDTKFGLIEPEHAAALYRTVLESTTETGIPILCVWPEADRNTRVIAQVDVDEDGLEAALLLTLSGVLTHTGPLHAVLLSAEAWVRGYASEAAFLADSDEDSLSEAIVLTYVGRSTEWHATQSFTRTATGIVWHDDLVLPEALPTPSLGVLRAAVSL